MFEKTMPSQFYNSDEEKRNENWMNRTVLCLALAERCLQKFETTLKITMQ